MPKIKPETIPEFREQFSKRLARWTAVFWFVYMTWLSVIFILEPATALYNVYMGLIATIVMIVNVWAYTRNSVYEKSVIAMIEKTKLELSLKANGGNPESKSSNSEQEQEESEEEGDSNG